MTTTPNNRIASKGEVQAAFVEQKESLYWTALVITGNADNAAQSIVDAVSLAETNSYVFRDWLIRWAHTSTARVSLQNVNASIRAAAEQYVNWTCSHSNHDPLLPEEIARLQNANPYEIVRALDPLARAVLILRGCQHASVADCALLLGIPLRCVLGAYCRALQWLREGLLIRSKASESLPSNLSFESEVQPK